MAEPVSTTIVLAALAAGAGEIAKGALSEAGKQAFNRLRGLVLAHSKDDATAPEVLAEYEKDPRGWEKPMEKVLRTSGAADDAEVLQQAHQVLQIIRPEQSSAGKYNVQVTGNVQGGIWGDNANQENKFGPSS